MGDVFGVSPGRLRAVAEDLREVSAAMAAVMERLSEELAGAGAPWGTDQIGEAFAEGAGGYNAQLGWVCGSVDAKTTWCDDRADRVTDSADFFERADDTV